MCRAMSARPWQWAAAAPALLGHLAFGTPLPASWQLLAGPDSALHETPPPLPHCVNVLCPCRDVRDSVDSRHVVLATSSKRF